MSPQLAGQAAIYRCPGEPAVYTSDQRFARINRCTLIGKSAAVALPARVADDASIATQPSRQAESGSTAKETRGQVAAPASRPPVSAQQRARDSDRLAILETELRRTQVRLVALAAELRQAEGEATTPEQKITGLKQEMARSESDIAALKREIDRAQ